MCKWINPDNITTYVGWYVCTHEGLLDTVWLIQLLNHVLFCLTNKQPCT